MRIQLIHPIEHDQKTFSRGIHDLDDALAKHFLKTAPHAALMPNPRIQGVDGETVRMGVVRPAADASAGKDSVARIRKILADGTPIGQVAKEYGLSLAEARKFAEAQ